MSFARLLRRWLPLLALVITALGSWQAAQLADTDEANTIDVAYENQLGTPLLSARRVPETLQAPIADEAVQPVIDAFVDSLERAQPDLQTCLVVEVNGRILRNEGANLALIPASNQKLLTTFAALNTFDADHRFTTTVASNGSRVEGVLDGDLYLVGGGDPFLVTDNWRTQYLERDENGDVVVNDQPRPWSRLEDLADDVAASGITTVNGTLFADETLFDTVRFGPWAERLIAQNQSGPLSALAVNEGFARWSEDNPAFANRVKADDPAANAASVFAALLAQRGVTVGATGVGQLPPSAVTVATLDSVPMSELITHVNSWSNNFGAEILLKHIGRVVNGEGSTAAGAAAVRSILAAEPDLDLNGIVIDDGSGLAETNRVTCSFLNDLLVSAGFDSPLAQSLSIGGERGSLAGRHDLGIADGLLYAKTGTLNPSTALSGYLISADDPDVVLTFSYISNADFVNPPIVDLQEPFIDQLVTYPDAPDLEVLDPLDPVPT
jgi:D-alanyl-D-alanine carboxypeptidase/D-alanyl-D-alanine-endopeptidase (penicillin-binding protein 4)